MLQEDTVRYFAGDRLVANTFVLLRDCTSPSRQALLRAVPHDIEAEIRTATAEADSNSSRETQESTDRFRHYTLDFKPLPIERTCWNVSSRSVQQVRWLVVMLGSYIGRCTHRSPPPRFY